MPIPVLERAIWLFPGVDFVNADGLTETSSTIAVRAWMTTMLRCRAIRSHAPDSARPVGSFLASRLKSAYRVARGAMYG